MGVAHLSTCEGEASGILSKLARAFAQPHPDVVAPLYILSAEDDASYILPVSCALLEAADPEDRAREPGGDAGSDPDG